MPRWCGTVFLHQAWLMCKATAFCCEVGAQGFLLVGSSEPACGEFVSAIFVPAMNSQSDIVGALRL